MTEIVEKKPRKKHKNPRKPRELDRRVRRTRKSLRSALLELVQEKDYNEITVIDITERADIRRATFYLHFKDKDELLKSAIQVALDDFAEQLDPHLQKDHLHISEFEAMYKYAAEHADLYRALLGGQSSPIVTNYIRDYLAQHKLNKIQASEHISTIPDEVIAMYAAGAEVSMLRWWLENDMPCSPKKMAQRVFTLLMNGITPR